MQTVMIDKLVEIIVEVGLVNDARLLVVFCIESCKLRDAHLVRSQIAQLQHMLNGDCKRRDGFRLRLSWMAVKRCELQIALLDL